MTKTTDDIMFSKSSSTNAQILMYNLKSSKAIQEVEEVE